MNNEEMEKLLVLTSEAKQAWLEEGVVEGVALEPFLLKILNHIKLNDSLKDIYINYFIMLIGNRILGPFEIIVFCMRELKWPEVAEQAIYKKNNSDDPRVISVMNDILAVYEDEWEDADLYSYYS